MAARDDDEKTDPGIEIPSAFDAAFAEGRMPVLGALTSLMKDPTITEIMVNDVRNVMVEKNGKIGFSGLVIDKVEELNRIVQSILQVTLRTLDSDHPYLDVALADGSRVNIIVPPVTRRGPCITIRKFPTQRFAIEDLLRLEMMDLKIAQFLKASVIGRMNILISGGTGGGKTTLLNALTQSIPKAERLVTIEDTLELAIKNPNSVSLLTKPEATGKTAVTARELVKNALRMRPDRILVGECRSGEAFDMLQAMNTGHDGSMSTIHANTPRDALFRLETLSLMSGVDLPLIAIRKQISSALDLLVQIKRFRNGKRRITQISEVTGVEGDTITLQDIYHFETDPHHPDAGQFKGTGLVPTFLGKMAENGVEIPKDYFA